MRKFDLSLRSSRSSYFATFRHQLTILSKTDALDEEKWLNMLGTFVKDWFRYESHFVHGRDSLVDLQDAFSRSGWLWPVDAKGEPLKATSYMADGFYVAKYVNKKSDMDLAAKGLGAKEWNNSLKTKLSLLPKKLFRIRMSRNFGMKMLTMTNLSTECLIQLTKLGYDATPFN